MNIMVRSNRKLNHYTLFFLMIVILYSCGKTEDNEIPFTPDPKEEIPVEQMLVEGVDYFLPKIDLNHWKVTLPIGNPSEVKPPDILDYATNKVLQEFMYNDSTDGSLVFYTYPGSTTANSSYSRTELREQMVPGSNSTNWKFSDIGIMEGTLAVTEMSKDKSGDYHRAIIMQIHGRLSNEQRDLIGEDDNNAPPVLKIYWEDGKVLVKTKILKDKAVDDVEMLKTSSWKDDEGYFFSTPVGHEKFTLKIEASKGTLSVTLNGDETTSYKSDDLERWDVFENYFKAGNYLVTTDEGAFSKIKYYTLDVVHP